MPQIESSESRKASLITPLYISVGCNQCPKALDWGGTQHQLAYAFSNSVALMSAAEPFEVRSTLNKHTDRVNCVRWITTGGFIGAARFGQRSELVSASKDKTLVLWQGSDFDFTAQQVLQGHTGAICVLDAMYYEESNERASAESPAKDSGNRLTTYIVSGSVDSTVRIWARASDFREFRSGNTSTGSAFHLAQTITAKANGFALALKLYRLPLSKLPMLLIGFDNHKVEIHVRLHNTTSDADQFYCLHTLVGHEDWIRDIDVCETSVDQLLIASSSQDNYIRLWKLDSCELASRAVALSSAVPLVEQDTATVPPVAQHLTTTTTTAVAAAATGTSIDKEAAAEDDDEDDSPLVGKKGEQLEEELKLKSSLFTLHSTLTDSYVEYSMKLESVLYGHEDWIYTVKFEPRASVDAPQPLCLISASMDKTLVVWRYDPDNGVWIDAARVGDIGGTTLGFYGATFAPDGKHIVAHGYQGALHLWKRTASSESLTPVVINQGHFGAVQDLCWEPEQRYLVSVSADQTTRFHGCWTRSAALPDSSATAEAASAAAATATGGAIVSWHELGRPQIHGYDLQCVAFIDRFKFVSGADEKLLRVFQAPAVFLDNFAKLSLDEGARAAICQKIPGAMAQGASVPALGLSNKAVYNDEKATANKKEQTSGETATPRPSLAEDLYKEVYFNIIDLNKPPSEEHLLQNTLWPEVQKLYGHGYELFALATEASSRQIASACKASKPDHATILVWQEQALPRADTSASGGGETAAPLYKQVAALAAHELTVVQIKFSHTGRYLLSVSRDRTWKLFERLANWTDNGSSSSSSVVGGSGGDTGDCAYALVAGLASKNAFHTRIVWSCDWSHDDRYFVTASRDKRVCVWRGAQSEARTRCEPGTPLPAVAPVASVGKEGAAVYLELSEPVTACAFAPRLVASAENGSNESYLLALGTESGKIELFTWSEHGGFVQFSVVADKYAHHLPVKRLCFRHYNTSDEEKNNLQMCLASCSDDHSVRLFIVSV